MIKSWYLQASASVQKIELRETQVMETNQKRSEELRKSETDRMQTKPRITNVLTIIFFNNYVPCIGSAKVPASGTTELSSGNQAKWESNSWIDKKLEIKFLKKETILSKPKEWRESQSGQHVP